MATATRDYRYAVEFNVHAVDAPGTRLINQGDIYVNICLLGMHKQTRLMPAYLPMHTDQKLYFDKVFKFCYEADDVIQRLEREHILIELIQKDFPTPVLLASYEACAKDFLYPYSWERIEYTGLRRYVLLNRTIDFPGISPSFEFSTSPTVDDVTGVPLSSSTKLNRQTKSIKRSKSPSLRPSSSFTNRSGFNNSGNLSSSITSHTISSAVKNNYGQRETQEKLRELAVDTSINPILALDKTKGRPPFVVRHVTNDLIGRKPKSHAVLKDSLVVNDYTLSRPDTSTSLQVYDPSLSRTQSLSPVLGRSMATVARRSRSPSPSRRSPSPARRSASPSRRSPSPRRHSLTDYDDYIGNIDAYISSPPRYTLSPTLHRGSFRYRYGYSPATDLSDKVIHTLHRNLDHYAAEPWLRYYGSYAYPYPYGYIVDDLL
ncbi:unnamed protein product [Adineta steineri]|uniref:Spermatogenesis-associated protein 6 N-terminal domain-containing protein n=1 Tax=Adineta steineri TaxID=433720 RepID=A0A814X0Z3_9BILA|nr:unnamed protein product [Adineta steineri]